MFNACIWIPKLICILLSVFHYNYLITNLQQWTKSIFYEGNYELSTTKYKQKINKRNKYKTTIQHLLLISFIPQFELAVNKNLSSSFNAFLNKDGILQTNKLPNNLINDLKELTDKTKLESMIPNDQIQTGIINSDNSILCKTYKNNFLNHY